MTHHPKERPGYLSRRDFLARAAGTGFAISGAGSLLAACSSSTTVAQETSTTGELLGPGGLPLARPDKRVTPPALGGPDRVRARARDRRHLHGLQLSGLPLQEAPQGVRREVRGRRPVHRLRQHHLRDQAPRLRRGAARRHGDDARQPRPGGRRQADQAAQPRLHPEPAEERLARARRPLLRRWLALHRAVHLYATGIAWRTDHVTEDIASMEQPWDIFWQAEAYKGKTALLSVSRARRSPWRSSARVTSTSTPRTRR